MNTDQGKPMGCFARGCLFFALHTVWIGLFLGGLYYAYLSAKLTVNGVEADAVVVDFDIHNGSDGSTTYSPIYEYSFEGKTYRYNSVNSSSAVSDELGDHVTLLIDPSNPEFARKKGFSEMWLLPSILIPVSLSTGVFMIFLGFLASKFGRITSMGSIKFNV